MSWIWQAGGIASRTKPVIDPEDARGLKIRGGSREMDLILKATGAAVVSLPSNEIYAAMQTGAMEAALTSSTSLISFRLEEVSKALTTGRAGAYWFMFETVALGRSLMGGNGIVSDYGMAKIFADAEAIYTYEGSHEIGRASCRERV